jgi:hypothetical protein
LKGTASFFTTSTSNHRSKKIKKKNPKLLQIWPGSRAPLHSTGMPPYSGIKPTEGIKPTNLPLLCTTEAARPSLVQAAAPPESRQKRARERKKTLKSTVD